MYQRGSSHRASSLRRTLTVLGLAWAGSIAVYCLALTRPMWLPSYFDRPHMDTPRILGVSDAALAHFALAFAILFLLYLVAFSASGGLSSPRDAAVVLAGGALLSIPLVLMHPGGAGDIYAYIAWSDVALRGHNPFVTPPAAIPGYALLRFLDFPNETVQYGPLWVILSVLLRAPFGSDLLLTMVAFKIVAAASTLGMAWLAYMTLRRTSPGMAVPGMLLLAWNPLLLYEMAGNGHNDATMMVLVMLSVYLHVDGRRRSSVTAMLAAVLVKYVAAILLPLFLVAMLRGAGPPRRWLPGAAMFSLGVLAVGLALVAATTPEGTVGTILNRTQLFTTSPTAVVHLWLSKNVEDFDSTRLVVRLSQAIFGSIFLLQLWRVWRKPAELGNASITALLAFTLLGISWFQPWYVAWAIPVALIAPMRGSTAVVVGLSIGAVLVHGVMGFGWRLEWLGGNLLAIQTAGMLSAWLPVPIAVLLGRAWQVARHGTGRTIPGTVTNPDWGSQPARRPRGGPAGSGRRAA